MTVQLAPEFLSEIRATLPAGHEHDDPISVDRVAPGLVLVKFAEDLFTQLSDAELADEWEGLALGLPGGDAHWVTVADLTSDQGDWDLAHFVPETSPLVAA